MCGSWVIKIGSTTSIGSPKQKQSMIVITITRECLGGNCDWKNHGYHLKTTKSQK